LTIVLALLCQAALSKTGFLQSSEVFSPAEIMRSVVAGIPDLNGAEVVFDNVKAIVKDPEGREKTEFLNGSSRDLE